MSFTPNQGFETQVEGQADWDSGLNANFVIADRGWHITLIAAEPINTGDVIWASSGAYANQYNPNSLALRDPIAISYKFVDSGESDLFLARGTINSMGIWSGFMVPGKPVFPDVVSPGAPVSSFSAAFPAVGIALTDDSIYFSPGHFSPMPEEITSVVSLALVTGSAHLFEIDVGHRGLITEVKIVATSNDAHKFRLFSGALRISSEILYETLTTSIDGGALDFDIDSIIYEDTSPFKFINTDVASPGLIFGRIDAQSASSVGSSDISVTLTSERFR